MWLLIKQGIVDDMVKDQESLNKSKWRVDSIPAIQGERTPQSPSLSAAIQKSQFQPFNFSGAMKAQKEKIETFKTEVPITLDEVPSMKLGNNFQF